MYISPIQVQGGTNLQSGPLTNVAVCCDFDDHDGCFHSIHAFLQQTIRPRTYLLENAPTGSQQNHVSHRLTKSATQRVRWLREPERLHVRLLNDIEPLLLRQYLASVLRPHHYLITPIVRVEGHPVQWIQTVRPVEQILIHRPIVPAESTIQQKIW